MVATLNIQGLNVSTRSGQHLLKNLNFTISPGERVGIVGASGSGKSLTAGALCGLLRPPLHISGGTVTLGEQSLKNMTPRQWRTIRGRRIFQIFQSPGSALNPARRIGPQLTEAAWVAGVNPTATIPAALTSVLLDPSVCTQFPYQLSGGMKQRVLIAMALILRPDILIADEPTTGLDVLTETEVLKALGTMIAETGASLLFISHDLRAVRSVAQRVLVMQQGEIVQDSPADELGHAKHPVARLLAEAADKLGALC